MENHKEMSLSDLRTMIIRYGAKYMEAYESDLYYDCNGVGNLQPGESVFWFVSAMHTYLYTAQEIHEHNLNLQTLDGNRFNYRIDCKKGKMGENEYSMWRVGIMEVAQAVNEYQKSVVMEG